jgi:hypothetical protein
MAARVCLMSLAALTLVAIAAATPGDGPPPYAATKVDGTDGVEAVVAMDWERLSPGHPGPDGRQIGTKDDARLALSYLQDLSAAVKQAANEGRRLADAMQNIKLPKYAKFLNYEAYLPLNIERYCDFYSLGI